MPGNGDPPPPEWEIDALGDPVEFARAKALTVNGYDGSNESFKDAGGTPYYLFAGTGASAGVVAWFCRKTADSRDAPLARIPHATWAVIKDGALDTQTGVITANGVAYRLDLRRDAMAIQVAYAKVV